MPGHVARIIDDAGGAAISPRVVSSVHAFVLRRIGNRDDAAEIAQQALLLACSDQTRRRVSNPGGWVLCIAHNLVVDHYRFENRYESVELGEDLADSEPVLQSRPDVPAAIHESRERLRNVLDDAKGRLCLLHQVALLLADAYGHCDKHSAEVLGLTVPSYKLLLHRARAAVRRKAPGRTRTKVRAGVTCRLSAARLRVIRRRLLDGLRS